ncbi:MAG: hypothetical protein WDW38_008627 [Sanguina aurantia]
MSAPPTAAAAAAASKGPSQLSSARSPTDAGQHPGELAESTGRQRPTVDPDADGCSSSSSPEPLSNGELSPLRFTRGFAPYVESDPPLVESFRAGDDLSPSQLDDSLSPRVPVIMPTLRASTAAAAGAAAPPQAQPSPRRLSALPLKAQSPQRRLPPPPWGKSHPSDGQHAAPHAPRGRTPPENTNSRAFQTTQSQPSTVGETTAAAGGGQGTPATRPASSGAGSPPSTQFKAKESPTRAAPSDGTPRQKGSQAAKRQSPQGPSPRQDLETGIVPDVSWRGSSAVPGRL